eukprot:375054_1
MSSSNNYKDWVFHPSSINGNHITRPTHQNMYVPVSKMDIRLALANAITTAAENNDIAKLKHLCDQSTKLLDHNLHAFKNCRSWYSKDMSRLQALITPNSPAIKSIKLASNDLKCVMSYVQKNIKYEINYSGKYMYPSETLSRAQGVCLEFANLAVTLLRHIGYSAQDVWVIIGYKYNAIKKKREGHAYVKLKGTLIEPQSGSGSKNYGLLEWTHAYAYNDVNFIAYPNTSKEGKHTVHSFIECGK